MTLENRRVTDVRSGRVTYAGPDGYVFTRSTVDHRAATGHDPFLGEHVLFECTYSYDGAEYEFRKSRSTGGSQ